VLANGAPQVAQKPLGRIPRLEPVLEILTTSQKPNNDASEGLIKTGASILRLVIEYDAQIARGLSASEAIAIIRAQSVRHDCALVESLETMVGVVTGAEEISEVCVGRLAAGMAFMDDLRTSVGTVLVPKGFEVTETFLERMRNFGPGILQERVRVAGPAKQRSRTLSTTAQAQSNPSMQRALHVVHSCPSARPRRFVCLDLHKTRAVGLGNEKASVETAIKVRESEAYRSAWSVHPSRICKQWRRLATLREGNPYLSPVSSHFSPERIVIRFDATTATWLAASTAQSPIR
jgi:hypothetical protein